MVNLTFSSKSDQIQPLIDKLEKITSPEGAAEILNLVATDLELYTVLTPPPQTNEPLPLRYRWSSDSDLHKFPSLLAQRGFFAALNSGKIEVPYRRTGELERSPTFDLSVINNTLTISLIVPEKIGRLQTSWILGEVDEQSLYFREHSFWEPLFSQAQVNLEETLKVAEQSLEQHISEYLGSLQ